MARLRLTDEDWALIGDVFPSPAATGRPRCDPRRVLAGTDCGFGTAAGLGEVADEVVSEKLRALRAGAELATQRQHAAVFGHERHVDGEMHEEGVDGVARGDDERVALGKGIASK